MWRGGHDGTCPFCCSMRHQKRRGNETIRGDDVIVASFRLSLRHRWWRGGHIRRWLMYARSAALDSHPLPLLAHVRVCKSQGARACIHRTQGGKLISPPSLPFLFTPFFHASVLSFPGS